MRVFSICDFGATTSDALQTKAIQDAIDACFLQGGGRVLIPCGVYLTGGLRLRSGVQLYLESGAILKGSLDPEDYMGFWNDTLEPVTENPEDAAKSRSAVATSRWSNGLIRALNAENISIIGEKGSYLDGSNTYDAQGEEGYRGPHALSLWNCKNIHLEGYTILHSANWAHAIFQSEDITVRNVSVYGGHDGFDIRTCDRVLVENCLFHTGDDCIAGFDNHDVVVRNCDFQSACNVIRFGGNHILIENCKSTGPSAFGFRGHIPKDRRHLSGLTDEGCRHLARPLFNYYCDFRAEIRKTPEDIRIKNCSFDGISQLFRLDFDGEHRWCCNRSLSEITFEDCEFLNLCDTGFLHGDQNEPVRFSLKRCRITGKDGCNDFPILECTNFEIIHLEDVVFENYPRPTFVLKSEGELRLIRTEGLHIEKI